MTPRPSASLPAGDGDALGAAIVDLLGREGRRPRLLGFGEPTHGEDEFRRLRNGLFAHLVEHAGFRSIALESSAWAGRLVDAHVRDGLGDEEDVMAHGFSHGFGASAANRDLVRWMRTHNAIRPAEQRLRFAGFDAPTEMAAAPSPREALAAVHAYLDEHLTERRIDPSWDTIDDLLGDEARWIDPEAAWHPTRSIGSAPAVRELRAITDDLRWLLAGEAPVLTAQTSPEGWSAADLAGRTAAGLLAYHAAMARDVPWRWAHLSAIRDRMMADEIEALAAREADRGPTLVFAHNLHLRTGTAASAGAHLAARYGADYAVVGTALGRAPHLGIGEPEPDTLEGALAALRDGNHLVTAEELRAGRAGRSVRTSANPAYIALDHAALDDLDAVVFVSETPG